MTNVNADTAKLIALQNRLEKCREQFARLNEDMDQRLKGTNSLWQDVQYTKFYGKFKQNVYSAIDGMNGEIQRFEVYLGDKIGQLQNYLKTEI